MWLALIINCGDGSRICILGIGMNKMLSSYVTRILVRVSDTIRIGYADTHFLKKHRYGDTARII